MTGPFSRQQHRKWTSHWFRGDRRWVPFIDLFRSLLLKLARSKSVLSELGGCTLSYCERGFQRQSALPR